MVIKQKKIIVYLVVSIVGFACLQAARLIDTYSGPYSSHPFALFGLAVDGVTFLVIALLSYRGTIERPEPLFKLGTIAVVIYLVMIVLDPSDMVLLAMMKAFAGVGWSLNILCWMSVFLALRPKMALPAITLAYLVDEIIYAVVYTLGIDSRGSLIVVFITAIVCLLYCLRVRVGIRDELKLSMKPTTPLKDAYSRTQRAVIGTAVFSLLSGFVLESDRITSGLEYAQTGLTSLFCIAIAAVVLVLLLISRTSRINIDYVFPIATLGFAMVLLIRSLGVVEDAIMGSAMVSILITFYVLLWLLFISEAYERMLPDFFLLGIALGAARLSIASGRYLAQEILDVRPGLEAQTIFQVLLALLTISLAAMFLHYIHYSMKRIGRAEDDSFRNDELASEFESAPDETWKIAAGSEPAVGSTPHGMEASALSDRLYDELEKRYRLTERELEVIRDYSIGRSAYHIADTYVLSVHTVKTYLRRVYTKLGVHSRQELLDLFAALEDDLDRSTRA